MEFIARLHEELLIKNKQTKKRQKIGKQPETWKGKTKEVCFPVKQKSTREPHRSYTPTQWLEGRNQIERMLVFASRTPKPIVFYWRRDRNDCYTHSDQGEDAIYGPTAMYQDVPWRTMHVCPKTHIHTRRLRQAGPSGSGVTCLVCKAWGPEFLS